MALPEDNLEKEEDNDFFDISDVVAAPFRGIEGAFQGAYNLVDYLAFDVLPDYDTRFLGTSKTMAGGAVEGIFQFATGFVPLFGLLGKAGKARGVLSQLPRHRAIGGATSKVLTTDIGRGVVAGGITDFTFFNGQEARLSNLIQQVPELQNPVTEFLAHDADETELEGRMKNVLEGLGLEAVAFPFIAGLKAIKRGRTVKEKGGTPQQQAEVVAKELKSGRIFVDYERQLESQKGADEFDELFREVGGDPEEVPQVDLRTINWDTIEIDEIAAAAPSMTREEAEAIQAGGILDFQDETAKTIVKHYKMPGGSFKTIILDRNDPSRIYDATNYVDMLADQGAPRARVADLDQKFGGINESMKKDFYQKTLVDEVGKRMDSDAPMTARQVLEDIQGRTGGLLNDYDPIVKKLLALGEDTGIDVKVELKSKAKDLPKVLKRGSFYDSKTGRIVIDDEALSVKTNPVYNILHEATHAVTVDNAVKHYDRSAFNKVDVNNIAGRAAVVDAALKQTNIPKPVAEMLRMFKKVDAMREEIATKGKLITAEGKPDLYWMKNPQEFMSFAFSDPQVQRALKGIQYTPKMTMWQKFVNTVKSLFGRGVSTDLMDNIVSRVGEISEMKLPTQRGRGVSMMADESVRGAPEFKKGKEDDFLGAIPEKFRGYADELLKGGTPRLPQFALETGEDVVVLKDILEKYYKENPDKVTVADVVSDVEEQIETKVRMQAKEGEDVEKVLRDVRITQQAYREQGKSIIQNISELAKEAEDNGYGSVAVTQLKNAFQQLIVAADVYRKIGRETAITLQARRENLSKSKIGLSETESQIEGLRNEFINNSGGVSPKKMVKWVQEHIDPDDLDASLDKMFKTAKKAQGKSFLDMPTEYWMNSILSGPKTQMVNIMGNSLTQVFTTLEAVAGGIMSGNTDVIKAVIASWSDAEMFKEAAKFAKKAFKDQDNLLDPSNRAFEEGQRRAITSERFGGLDSDSAKKAIDDFGNIIRIPSRLLLTTDEFFKQLAYRRAARLKAAMSGIQQGITDPKSLANHINKTVDGIVTEGGRMMSEEGLVREASSMADKKGLKGKDKANFVIKYKDDNFNPDSSALMQYALDEAQYLTFTKELQDRTLGKVLQEATNKLPFLRFVVPFVRTPTNILKFAAERTPFAIALKEERQRFFDDYKSGDPIRIARANGKMITGTLVGGIMIDVINNNREYITGGGPSNEREKEALMATGWRPYSIKMGDTYYSYQKLDPIATILGIYADMVEVIHKEEKSFDETATEHAFQGITLSIVRNFTNKSYLAGIQMWADALGDPDRYIEKLGRNYVGSFVPNVLSQMADYDTQAIKEARGLVDVVKKKVGMRGSLDTKRNILGEEYKAEQWMGTGFINPIRMSTKKDDPILNEMASLNHAFRNPEPNLGGQIDLLEYENEKGQSAHDRRLELLKVVKLGGLTLRQSLNKLIKSRAYQRLSPESEPGLLSPRISQINSLLSKYRKAALRETLREYPELDRQYSALTRAKAGFKTGMQREDVLALLQ